MLGCENDPSHSRSLWLWGVVSMPGLEERVDEWGGSRGAQGDEQSDQSKHQKNRDQPPLFVFGNENGEFLYQRQRFFVACLFEFILFFAWGHAGNPRFDVVVEDLRLTVIGADVGGLLSLLPITGCRFGPLHLQSITSDDSKHKAERKKQTKVDHNH